MVAKVLTIVTLISLLSGTGHALKKIVLATDTGYDQITYDETRVSEQQLRLWMQFSPHLNTFAVPEMLATCIAEDSNYHKPCGTRDPSSPTFFVNADLNLQRIRHRIDTILNPINYPPELQEVVQYLRQVHEFWYWAESQELKFLRTGDVSYLEEHYGNGSPPDCSQAIQRVRDAPNLVAAHESVRVDWGNCVWEWEHKKLGDFPLKSWSAFLKAYNIQERDVSADD